MRKLFLILAAAVDQSPYSYFRLTNPDPDDGTPNFIYVVYGRATRLNMQKYARWAYDDTRYI